MKLRLPFFVLALVLCSCQGFTNKETSEIGSYDWTCLKESDLFELEEQYNISDISDSVFADGLEQIRNHWLKPKYILYFKDSPKEIVGFDGYSIRIAFNPDISYTAVDGLSTELTDSEQKRIRNRVLALIREKECMEGKNRIDMFMKMPAVFSEEYYETKN